MAEADGAAELLFFDTFSHEVDTDINLDLVQFPKPVYITQVRIIPLGARVQADFPGGVRLGATNPSKFDIEFFVNDLGIPGASTFENLGHLEYNQNDCIHLECNLEKIPTDGLVLRGWYSTITLAVYGILTNTVTEQIASPPPPPLPPLEPVAPEEVCSVSSAAAPPNLPLPVLVEEPANKAWKEPLLGEASHAHKSIDYERERERERDREREDLDYAISAREAVAPATAVNYHQSEDERERRMRKASHSSDLSASRNRTLSESNERDFLRSRSDRERDRERDRAGEKDPRDWSRSPDYQRRSHRNRSDRSRSDAEDGAPKWPRTPPTSIDSPTRPRSPDPMDYEDSEDVIGNGSHYKTKSRSYIRDSNESLTPHTTTATQDLPAGNDDDENPGTPGEQFEPILSDDEIIGDENESSEQAAVVDEYELEIDLAASNASPAIKEFDPFKMPLQRFESDLGVFFSKEIDKLSSIFKKFEQQTKIATLELYKASSTNTDERENFVYLGEQLINLLLNLSQNFTRRNFVLKHYFKLSDSNLEQAFNILRIGMDFEAACLQPQPAFKIRHIKIGALLMELLGSSAEFIEYLLQVQKFEPFAAVFQLYEQEFMAMSIKLMLLKAVYALLDTKSGIQTFTTSKVNGYHWLLQHIQQTPLTRTKYALKSILRKVHLNESLDCMRNQCFKRFVLQTEDEHHADFESFKLIELCILQLMDAFVGNVLSYQQPRRFLPVSKKFEVVVDSNAQRCYANTLQSYFNTHALAECLLLLFSNAVDLPATLLMSTLDLLQALLQTQIGIDYFVDDCFETTKLLVALLLGIEDVQLETQILVDENVERKEEENGTVKEVEEVAKSCENQDMNVEKGEAINTDKSGEQNDETNATEKAATKKDISTENMTPPSAPEEIKVIPGSVAKNANSQISIRKPLFDRLQKLGIELAYKIQTRYHLDAIVFTAAAATATTEYDAITLASHLHALYSQTCNAPGRQYTIDVIGSNNNLQIFMDLIKKEQRLQTQQQLATPGSKYKSPVLSYAIDMVDCCVRHCENLEYLVEHGAKTLELAKNHDNFESSASAVLQEMFIYLRPLEVINIFAYDDITPLVEAITRSLEYITTFPGDLIMGLRILHHLAIGRPTISPTIAYKNLNHTVTDVAGIVTADTEELRHRFVLLQFYALDGVQILTQILEKLCCYFEQPGLHAPSLITIQGTHCCQIILPTLQILREMLAFAIQCRDVEFKDVTAIDHLMKTYFLMHYLPDESPSAAEAAQARKEIIKVLLSYTQPNEQDVEFLHKSLWTQMVREVLKNVLQSPSTYIPGLKVLAELLPLPLPLPLPPMVQLQDEQTQRLITERKLWSAHLHPQSSQLAKLIEAIAPTSFPQLADLLTRVCLQLADLAPNMTLLISKTITDLLCAEWTSSSNVPTQHLSRLLNFFSQLTMYPSVKSSALSILSGKVWDLFQAILCFTDLKEIHLNCQLFVHRVLESFLDSEISLMSPQCTSSAEVNLASALPPKELIPRIAEAILTNLLRVDVTHEVASAAVRNLVILIEHDITFYHLLQQLRHNRSEFQLWLQKLVTTLETGKYNPLIETVILLLRSLMHMEEESAAIDAAIPPRTLKVTPNELSHLLGYKKGSKDSDVETPHLLQRLHDALEQHKSDTETRSPPSSLFLDINGLIAQLKTTENSSGIETDEDSIPCAEPQLPQTEGIVTQYAARPIFTQYESSADETQLCSHFWLDPLRIDNMSKIDFDSQCERILCDLTDLANTCLTADTNLLADCKRVLHLSSSPQSNRERTPTAPCFRTRRVEVEPSTGRPEKKIYITPVRGRGFTRTPPSRGDLFRSRPPNTSRPPSLHVDDFLALETCGAQPTGPTGYNKIPPLMRGSRVGRNRGSRIAAGVASYRKPKLLRTSSPSTWNDGGSQHYRSATSEPVNSHFVGDSHYSPGPPLHFGGRSRGRGGRSRSYLR